MASLHNIAMHTAQKKDPSAEDTLLAMWEGRDATTKTESICVRWSHDSKLLAAGGGDGVVRFFDASNGQHLERSNLGTSSEPVGMKLDMDVKMPVMCMRFHPDPRLASRLRVAYADNTVELYDLKTKSSRASTREVDNLNNKKKNQILALDYNVDGTQWATGGQDRIVRVYDETQPKEPKREFRAARTGTMGHSNRVCAVRFSPDKPSVVASAGLDGLVLVWDLRDRSGEPLMSIPDVAVAGDALDIRGHELLVGSWRPDRQLQTYDLRNEGRLAHDIPWRKKRPQGQMKTRWGLVREAVRGSCNVYGASFITSGACEGGIVAGGTGSKELKCFLPHPTDPNLPPEPVGSYKVPSGVHGLHVNPEGNLIGVAAVDGSVIAVKMPTPSISKRTLAPPPYPVEAEAAESNAPFITAGSENV